MLGRVLGWPLLEKREDPESWFNMKQVGETKVSHFLKWISCEGWQVDLKNQASETESARQSVHQGR